jgi:hypothetical protein
MKNFKLNPSIQKIESIIERRDYKVVSGYLGTSSQKSKTRIYLSKSKLDTFVEIDTANILDAIQDDPNDEWLLNFIVISNSKAIYCHIESIENIFGKSCDCGCDKDDTPNLSKKRAQDIQRILCLFDCNVAREKCIDDARAHGLSDAVAANICAQRWAGCENNCAGRGSRPI